MSNGCLNHVCFLVLLNESRWVFACFSSFSGEQLDDAVVAVRQQPRKPEQRRRLVTGDHALGSKAFVFRLTQITQTLVITAGGVPAGPTRSEEARLLRSDN